MWRVLPTMGLAQIIAWSTPCYPITALAEGISRDLGIGEALLFGAFTAGLFVSGLASPFAGRGLDVRGGRAVLIAGLAMAACLYDPAFAN